MSARTAATRGLGIGSWLLVTAFVSGCGGSQAPGSDSGAPIANLLAFNSLSAPPMPASTQATETIQCPPIEVLDGTASSRVYAGAEPSNSTVKYQFSMGDVVRECSHVGDQLVLKVGVEGRALIGPVGTPGSFSAPVRIAVRREKDEKAVDTKLFKVPVTIPAGDTQAPFSLVADTIQVPFVSVHADEDYTILVGFDAKGNGGDLPKPQKKRRRGG